MNLAQELRDQIARYVSGNGSLAELRAWLADHVQQIADSNAPSLNELDGKAWILISEYDYGHRNADDLRKAFSALLDEPGVVHAVVTDTPVGPRIVTGSSVGEAVTAFAELLEATSARTTRAAVSV